MQVIVQRDFMAMIWVFVFEVFEELERMASG
jgi:hypothetical protein